MGEIGDYWNEHKQYKRDKSAADSLGMSVDAYRRKVAKDKERDRAAAKAKKLARHTVQCECGLTFFDKNAHNCHKVRTGKLGHKGTAIHPSKDAFPDQPSTQSDAK